MNYHSYSVEHKNQVYDYNGDSAQAFLVILGGTDKVAIENELIDILEKNL